MVMVNVSPSLVPSGTHQSIVVRTSAFGTTLVGVHGDVEDSTVDRRRLDDSSCIRLRPPMPVSRDDCRDRCGTG